MAQIVITEGTIDVRVRRLENDESFEIDTPEPRFLRSSSRQLQN